MLEIGVGLGTEPPEELVVVKPIELLVTVNVSKLEVVVVLLEPLLGLSVMLSRW